MKNKEMLVMIIIVVVAAAVMYLSGIGCPILKFTGIPCFGCGMTRACISLVKLDFALAWQYHPMSFFMPFCIIALLLAKKMPKRLVKGIVITVVTLFVVVYFVRLADPVNEIVKWHPENGEIYKTVNRLLQR